MLYSTFTDLHCFEPLLPSLIETATRTPTLGVQWRGMLGAITTVSPVQGRRPQGLRGKGKPTWSREKLHGVLCPCSLSYVALPKSLRSFTAHGRVICPFTRSAATHRQGVNCAAVQVRASCRPLHQQR